MNNRINQLFETKKENILSVYFTAGLPELERHSGNYSAARKKRG
jgi:hypothetical protein